MFKGFDIDTKQDKLVIGSPIYSHILIIKKSFTLLAQCNKGITCFLYCIVSNEHDTSAMCSKY